MDAVLLHPNDCAVVLPQELFHRTAATEKAGGGEHSLTSSARGAGLRSAASVARSISRLLRPPRARTSSTGSNVAA